MWPVPPFAPLLLLLLFLPVRAVGIFRGRFSPADPATPAVVEDRSPPLPPPLPLPLPCRTGGDDDEDDDDDDDDAFLFPAPLLDVLLPLL